MTSNVPEFLVVIANRHKIEAWQRAVTEDERTFELLIDGLPRGEFGLQPWDQPCISVGATHVAVWGGHDVYVTPLSDGALSHVDSEWSVSAVYLLADRWCVVSELSVALIDPSSGAEVASFEHDEVLLRSWWSGDDLIVEDFEKRRIRFEALAVRYALQAILE